VAAGEYVAVEKIESVLKDCPVAEQVWAYGNSFESCLVAVVVPKQKPLMAWADKQGLQGSYEVRERTSRATRNPRLILLHLLLVAPVH
jgi:long-chain acyl-CoA synthetase